MNFTGDSSIAALSRGTRHRDVPVRSNAPAEKFGLLYAESLAIQVHLTNTPKVSMHVSHQNDALHRDLLSSLRYEPSPDTANKLRFVVITGIDRDHPAWYRLLRMTEARDAPALRTLARKKQRNPKDPT